MKKENLKHLKEVLSIPTKTWKEELMIQYLKDYCKEKVLSVKQMITVVFT